MSIQDQLIGQINGKSGAFGGRMIGYELEAFSFETTKKYILEKADYLEFTDDGIERFYKCTRGIPFYINVLLKFLSPDEVYDEKKVIEEFNTNVLKYIVI